MMLRSAAALLALLGGASAAPEPLSVLFVGNSYTFVNDVPSLVGRVGMKAADGGAAEAAAGGTFSEGNLNSMFAGMKDQLARSLLK